jgi:sigma-E factor negative regulatory protein RseB
VTGATAVTPAATGARLEVDAVLQRWEATVGAPRELDTGMATPVHLVRRSGAAIEEVVYVDEATSMPVRRETRDADGAVLRVVAYTSLSLLDAGSPAAVPTTTGGGPGPGPPDLEALAADGYEVPESLDAGFHLLSAGHHQGMVVARYGDGLSVLSVYQQLGRLDPSELDGATVEAVAGRHVWVWPGSEPLRLVWTGGGRTWTAVSDAPLEVVEDAISSLPGDRVGHDVPSRISRGVARALEWLRDVVPS